MLTILPFAPRGTMHGRAESNGRARGSQHPPWSPEGWHFPILGPERKSVNRTEWNGKEGMTPNIDSLRRPSPPALMGMFRWGLPPKPTHWAEISLYPGPTLSPDESFPMALVHVLLPQLTEVSSKPAPSKATSLKSARHHPGVLCHCLLYIHPAHFLVLPGTELNYIPNLSCSWMGPQNQVLANRTRMEGMVPLPGLVHENLPGFPSPSLPSCLLTPRASGRVGPWGRRSPGPAGTL